MDRLIIESTLADVSEIFLSKSNDVIRPNPSVVLGFKAINMDQIIHAFAVLKKIADQHEIDLLICKTMTSGIYDLEIKTEGLDEPIRISNKAISNEMLGAIEDQISKNQDIVLATNVSEEESWIPVHATHIKDCEVKL